MPTIKPKKTFIIDSYVQIYCLFAIHIAEIKPMGTPERAEMTAQGTAKAGFTRRIFRSRKPIQQYLMTTPRRKDGWLRYRADLRTLTAMQHPLRSDCKPVILGFLPPDEDWIPDTFEMAPDISIGATGT